jgi:hypothetical protein
MQRYSDLRLRKTDILCIVNNDQIILGIALIYRQKNTTLLTT